MDNLKTDEILENLKKNLTKMEEKDFSIYFFVIDTNGSPIGSVANIYEHVKMLNELGYKAYVLHEKNEYTTKQLEFIKNWLGSDYSSLPHASIEDKTVKIDMTDFIIIPELFANVMEQTVNLPGKRIVLCQSYDYITETLQPGKTWANYGITECITTTEKQKNYIDSLFNNSVKTSVIPVSIDPRFKKSEKPKKPIISIMTRDQRDTVKIFKSFYIKYPHLKWVTFRDMRGMTKDVFSEALKESCISVWVDDIAAFGTFPLESMACGTPVIGKLPSLVNDWLTEKNGIWVDNSVIIPDLLSQYIQSWLEDSVPSDIFSEMDNTVKNYTVEVQKEILESVYTEIFEGRKKEIKDTLEKYEVNNVEEQKN
jgi:hypothetical protein